MDRWIDEYSQHVWHSWSMYVLLYRGWSHRLGISGLLNWQLLSMKRPQSDLSDLSLKLYLLFILPHPLLRICIYGAPCLAGTKRHQKAASFPWVSSMARTDFHWFRSASRRYSILWIWYIMNSVMRYHLIIYIYTCIYVYIMDHDPSLHYFLNKCTLVTIWRV